MSGTFKQSERQQLGNKRCEDHTSTGHRISHSTLGRLTSFSEFQACPCSPRASSVLLQATQHAPRGLGSPARSAPQWGSLSLIPSHRPALELRR